MIQRSTAIAALVVAALSASTSGMFVRLIDCHALAIAGVRSAIGAAVFAAVLRRVCFSFSRLQVTGALVFAFHTFCFFAALRLTAVANAVFLSYTAPVFVPFFSAWIVGERAVRLDWLSIGVVVGGIALFFLDQLSLSGWWGNLLGLVAGLTFAWYTAILRHRSEEPLATLILGNLLAALGGLPFVFRDPPSLSDWGLLLVLGVFQFGFTYVLISLAIRRLTAMEALLILTLEPIFNSLWAFVVIGERPGSWAILGALVVLGGVVVRGSLSRSDRTAPPVAETPAKRR